MISPNGRTVEFGKGDIEIIMGASEGCAMLVMRNQEPHPIGERADADMGDEYDIRPQDLVMSFSRPESIDALIKCLSIIRELAFSGNPEGKDIPSFAEKNVDEGHGYHAAQEQILPVTEEITYASRPALIATAKPNSAFAQARIDAGMSQRRLAAAIGVSAPTIGNWETGKCQISPKYHAKLEEVLGVKLEDLLVKHEQGDNK